MRLRRAAFPLLAAAALAAAQDTAPLAESKRALQSLQKDRAAEKAKADEGLRLGDALPTVPNPAAEAPPPAPAAPRKPEREERPARNWLVDGYERLGATPGEGGEEVPLDPRDPEYFLRVYERQRAAADLARRLDAGARGGAPGAAGTMRPFLQEWLAGSPVQGALRDIVGGTGAAGGEGDDSARAGGPLRAREAGRPASSLGPGAGAAPGAAGSPPPNPFIAALGLDRPAVGPAPPVVVPPVAAAPGTSTAWPAAEPPKLAPRRPPSRPEDDAKKYFPQLRKF